MKAFDTGSFMSKDPCVTRIQEMCVGTFIASCRLVENRTMREGKLKTEGYVYLKNCGCENGGKTQEGVL